MSLPPAWHAYQTGVFWLIPESLSGVHGKETRGIGAHALFTAVLVSRFSWNSSNLAFRMLLPLCGSSRPGRPEQRPHSNSCWAFPADENESQTCLHIQRGLLTKYVDFFPGSLQQKAYVSWIIMTPRLFHHVVLTRAPKHCIWSFVHLGKGERKEYKY